ncbi:MAG: hypothetical protein M3Q73_03605 [bacterium]|nr:hypothetical protein [bacterium]
MKNIFKLLGIVILIILVGFTVLSLFVKYQESKYTKAGYYVGNTHSDALYVANLAVETEDPTKCDKIKLFNGWMISEEDLKNSCYADFIKLNTAESACASVPQIQSTGYTNINAEYCKQQAKINQASR